MSQLLPEVGDVKFDENQDLLVFDGERWVVYTDPSVADRKTPIRDDPEEFHSIDL